MLLLLDKKPHERFVRQRGEFTIFRIAFVAEKGSDDNFNTTLPSVGLDRYGYSFGGRCPLGGGGQKLSKEEIEDKLKMMAIFERGRRSGLGGWGELDFYKYGLISQKGLFGEVVPDSYSGLDVFGGKVNYKAIFEIVPPTSRDDGIVRSIEFVGPTTARGSRKLAGYVLLKGNVRTSMEQSLVAKLIFFNIDDYYKYRSFLQN